MPTSLSNRPIVALTMGDPSGVGPEIIIKSLARPSIRRLAGFIIVGDRGVLAKAAGTLNRSHRRFFKKIEVIELNKDFFNGKFN